MSQTYRCSDCGAETENSYDIKSVDGSEIILTVHRCDACSKKLDREFDWERLGETYEERGIRCPYCDFEYDDYDAYDFDEGTQEAECPECGKKFKLCVETYRVYSTNRLVADMPEDFNPEEADDAHECKTY